MSRSVTAAIAFLVTLVITLAVTQVDVAVLEPSFVGYLIEAILAGVAVAVVVYYVPTSG